MHANHQGNVLRPTPAIMCQTFTQSDKGTLGGGPGGTLHGPAQNFPQDWCNGGNQNTKQPPDHRCVPQLSTVETVVISPKSHPDRGGPDRGGPDLGSTIATLRNETGCPQFLSRLCLGEQTMRNQTISPPLWPFEEMYLPATHLGRRNILR